MATTVTCSDTSICKIRCALCYHHACTYFDTTLVDAQTHLEQHAKIPISMINFDDAYGNSLVCFVSQSEMMCCACRTRGFFSAEELMQHFTETHMQTPPRLSLKCPSCTFCGTTFCEDTPSMVYPLSKKEQAVSRKRHLDDCQFRWNDVAEAVTQQLAQQERFGLVIAHAMAMKYPRVNRGSPLKLVDENILGMIAGLL